MTSNDELEQRIGRLEGDMAQVLRHMQTLKAELERLSTNADTQLAAHNRLVERLTAGAQRTYGAAN